MLIDLKQLNFLLEITTWIEAQFSVKEQEIDKQ